MLLASSGSRTVADLHSKILDVDPHRGPNSFNFMQFLGKVGKIICWSSPLEGWRPHLGDILDPPLQDFADEGDQLPRGRQPIIRPNFAENCMK